MSNVIKISITAAASDAIRGLGETAKATDKLIIHVDGLDKSLNKVDGRNVKVNFSTKGLVAMGAGIALVTLAANRLTHGFPDLSFGLDAIATKMTLAAGAAIALTSASLPLAGALVAVGAAAGSAFLGLGLFAAVAIPTIKSVTGAVTQYNTASAAFDKAKATGNVKEQATQAKNMAAALSVLTPQQRQAATAILGMQDAWAKLSKTAAPVVLGVITGAAQTLNQVIPLLTPAITAMGKAIKAVSSKAFQQLLQDAKPLVNLIVTQGAPAFQSLADIGLNIARTGLHILTAFSPLGNTILPAVTNVTKALSKFDFGPIVKFITPLLPVVGKLLSTLGTAVGDLIKLAAPLAGPVLKALQGIASVLVTAFSSKDLKTFVSNIAKLVSNVAPIVSKVVPAFAAVAAILSGQLVKLMPIVVPLVGQIADAFVNVLAGLSPLLPSLLGLVSVFVSLLPSIYPVVPILRDALVPVVGDLGKALVILAPQLVPLATAFGQILIALAPLLPVIATLVASLATGLATALTKIAPYLASFASWATANPGIIKAVAITILVLVAAFEAATIATAALDAVMALHPFVLIALAVVAVAIGLTYLTVMTQIFQKIWAGLVTAFDWVRHETAVIFDNVRHSIATAFDSVITKITDVINWINGVPGKLVTLGQNIVQGLLNGIVGAWHFVTDKIHELVNLIPASIRKMLGIASPSRVTHSLGRAVGMGMANGLVSSMPAVASALRTMSSLPGVMVGGSGLQLSGSGATVIYNYNVNVSVPVSADQASIGRAIRTALQAAHRQDGLAVV